MSVDLDAIRARWSPLRSERPDLADVPALIADLERLREMLHVIRVTGPAREAGLAREALGMPDLSRPAEPDATLAKGLCPVCAGEGEVEETECLSCRGTGRP